MTVNDAVSEIEGDVPSFALEEIIPAFWRARFASPSQHWHHVPLLFWLCAILRPTNTAVVTEDDWVPFFAICQTIDKLRTGGTCTSLTLTPGGVGEQIKPITAHIESFYEDIADLQVIPDILSAIDRIANDRYDLRLIDVDCVSGREDCVNDLIKEIPENGAVILLGTKGETKLAQSNHTQLKFNSGSGLNIILHPTQDRYPVKRLIELTNSAQRLPRELDQVFRRLGSGLADSVALSSDRDSARDLELRFQRTQDLLNVAKSELADLEIAYEARGRAVANAQAEMHDAEKEHSKTIENLNKMNSDLQARCSAIQNELTNTKTLTENQAQQIRSLTEARERLEQKAADDSLTNTARELKNQIDLRYQELAVLTRELERQRAEGRELAKQVTRRDSEIKVLNSRITKIKSSLSWRLTAPIRVIK